MKCKIHGHLLKHQTVWHYRLRMSMCKYCCYPETLESSPKLPERPVSWAEGVERA